MVIERFDSLGVPLRPDNYLRVAGDPSPLFFETFDAGFDTQKFVVAGSVVPTQANGLGTVSAGTVALGNSSLTTVPTFPVMINMYNTPNGLIAVDAGLKTGAYRFFGLLVPSGSPTVTIPMLDGVGFEWSDTTGVLSGVVWSGSARTQSVSLAAVQPTDTANHRYLVYYKSSRAYFELDGVTVGSIAYPAPTLSNMNMGMISVNGGSTVSPAAVFTSTFIGVADSGSNSSFIADGVYPWRKVQVGTEGGLSTRHAGTFQATYSAAFNVAAAAAATDIATITGSATKTLYIQRIIVTGIQTTASLAEVLLIKRSTADTGGTSTGQTAVPHDSADAAASGTVLAYTVNPGALGTVVGTFRRAYSPVGGAASVVNPIVIFDFGDKGRAIILRGIAQQLAVNLNGATLTGGAFDIVIEWYEV
jgi:hypothetical protein